MTLPAPRFQPGATVYVPAFGLPATVIGGDGTVYRVRCVSRFGEFETQLLADKLRAEAPRLRLATLDGERVDV